MKKILLLFLAILIAIGIVLGIWYFFFRGEGTNIPFLEKKETSFGTFFDVDNTGNDFFDPTKFSPEEIPSDIDLNAEPPILRQLSVEPISGYIFFEKEFDVLNKDATTTETKTVKEKKVVYRFMERATGHIYETREDELTIQKINQETLPKIYKTTFFENGENLIYEKLGLSGENIDSFWGAFQKKGTTTDEVELKSEPFSIISSNFAVSPNRKEFVYQINTVDSSSIFLGDNKKTTPKEIFNSPIKEWLIDWQNDNLISLNTKPTSEFPGYLFLLNPKNGSIRKVVDGVGGLTSKISPSGKFVLFSEGRQSSISLFVKDLTTNQIKRLAISTLPEKCVFDNQDETIIYCGGPNRIEPAKYPDDWYKGKVSFDDFIWEINHQKGMIKSFYTFDDKDFDFDIVDVALSKNNKFFVFVNKTDLTLWSLDLERVRGQENFVPNSSENF